MAKQQPPHQYHVDMMNAFEKAEGGTRKNTALGGESYGMNKGGMPSAGMPRSPGQMSSVKKAARASATARGERALGRSPKAPLSKGPAANMAGPLKPPAGISTGGMGLATKPKKGLLSI